MTQQSVKNLLSDYASQIKALLGNKLDAVILYGSYARGDYEDGSDVDVMVLVNVPQEQIITIRNDICDIAFDLGWENHILLSPVIESSATFNKYKDASCFFKNVLTEGVRISA